MYIYFHDRIRNKGETADSGLRGTPLSSGVHAIIKFATFPGGNSGFQPCGVPKSAVSPLTLQLTYYLNIKMYDISCF
jgi:hypothetical protein